MKRLMIKSAALLVLIATLVGCVGCAAITDKLDSIFREETTAVDPSRLTEPEIEMPAKVKETYTFLIMVEATDDSVLDRALLLSFNTALPSVAALQLPTDLYLHISEQSIEGLFQNRYDAALAAGQTEKESAQAASESLVDVLSSGFHTPIDYYIHFTAAQFAGLVNTLGGVELTIPFTMGSLRPGAQTLGGEQAVEYLAHDSYSEQSYYDAGKLMTTAIFSEAKEKVESEMLSLFVMELRTLMTTNIPSDGGEDIFFVRKWLQTDLKEFRIANLSTQVVYISSSACRVLLEGNTVTQMNELLKIYEEELNADQFDPRYVFVDYSSKVAKAVYNSYAELPTIYTAKQISDGMLTLKK